MGRYLVLGSGRSGKAAAALLEASGREVVFADDFSGVVVSPGIPVKSELQFGCEELKRRGLNMARLNNCKNPAYHHVVHRINRYVN